MKCEQIREWIGSYWDMRPADLRKRSVDRHITKCAGCQAEFDLWKESTELIRSSIDTDNETLITREATVLTGSGKVADSVMDRIYRSESWRKPIAQRTYEMSYRSFRQLAVASAFFLAIFMISFTYSLIGFIPDDASEQLVGLQPVASYSSEPNTIHNVDSMEELVGSVASLTVPMALTPEPPQSELNFLLVFSLLGIVSVVLLMNWFSRIRA